MNNTKTTLVNIGLVQMSCSANPGMNLEKAVVRVREAADNGAQIICLQELYRSQYFCRTEDYAHFQLAETIPGPSTDAFSTIAKEKSVVVIVPLFEKRAQGIYHNSAAVIDADGTLLGTYRKMHIPDDPSFYEKFYFTPGDKGFITFQTRYATIGVLICWDQWYPEAARLTALKGAQILFYPTAIGWAEKEVPEVRQAQLSAWEMMQRSHSIANGVFVVSVNRVGKEGELEFWGNSFVSNPFGVLLAKTSYDREEIIVVECDLNQIDFYRTHWPFMRDRRIDAYEHITKRYVDAEDEGK
jgi:N-carbamoylputrescine amidase